MKGKKAIIGIFLFMRVVLFLVGSAVRHRQESDAVASLPKVSLRALGVKSINKSINTSVLRGVLLTGDIVHIRINSTMLEFYDEAV